MKSIAKRLEQLEQRDAATLGQRVFVGYMDGTYQEAGSDHEWSTDEIDALSAAGWHCIKIQVEYVDMEVTT